MDIKWKDMSHSFLTKAILFILIILCFSGSMTIFLNACENVDNGIDILSENDYFNSNEFISKCSGIIRTLSDISSDYRDEEYILNGNTVTDDDIKNQKISYFNEFTSTMDYTDSSSKEIYKLFTDIYENKISNIKDDLIKQNLENYRFELRKLDDYDEGVYYYIKDGKYILSNTSRSSKDFYKSCSVHFISDGTEQLVSHEQINDWLLQSENSSDKLFYFAYDNDYIDQQIEKWNLDKEYFIKKMYVAAALAVISLILLIYLFIIWGKKSFNDKQINLYFVDKLYNDINLFVCMALIGFWFFCVEWFLSVGITEYIYSVTLIIAALGLILVLSLVTHIKNKSLFKHSLICKTCKMILRTMGNMYDNRNIMYKIIFAVMVVVIFNAVVIITFNLHYNGKVLLLWMLFSGCIILLMVLQQVNKFKAIKIGVENIMNGDLNHKIKISRAGEFARLAENINNIAAGLNKAVENELKSERLKSELISNVSHDIRTPLTSIITYVDLLKKENNPNKQKEYIEVLEQKSQRLKVLTDDLFDASKVSSGNIPVNIETIDLISLLNQGLGEMDEKIQEAGLDFRISHIKEKVYVKADGKLLWRVIENLLSNVIKYALPGSRVYVDIESKEQIILTMKNISAFELNISSYELMERFTRGDKARYTEGSGLGLSIARNLMEIQKGTLDIEIDGDLFKVMIKMPEGI